MKKEIVIYQAKNGAIELRGDFSRETIWATQAQMAEVFGVTPQNITLHLANIYQDKELDRKATCKESLQVQVEGKRQIKRTVQLYNLDAIIAVGYRINSLLGTRFRQWATKTLREHIVQGYTINRKRLGVNYQEFMKSVENIQALLPERVPMDAKDVLELVKEFSATWVSLDAYDKGSLKPIGVTKRAVQLSGKELSRVINNFRGELIKKGEATDLFAREKNAGSVEGIVGNVMQSFGGRALYATIEEKAAHLLYFMVKNHPFDDGNKRSGAFAFIWFLRKTRAKGTRQINPGSLTALTLLVAESKPEKKEQMVALVIQLLR